MSLTGNPDIQAGFQPLVPDVSFADYNDFKALDAITDDLAAVILEVIQGEGGLFPVIPSGCRQSIKGATKKGFS